MAVAAPFVVGAALSSGPTRPEPSRPTVSVDTSCRAVAPTGPAPSDAAFIRFCDVDGAGAPYVPDVALTSHVAAVVERFQRFPEALCTEAQPDGLVIQLVRPDGSAITLSNTLCGYAYDVLMRAIGRQESAAFRDVAAPDVSCFSDSRALGDGGVALDALGRLPVTAAVLCETSADDRLMVAPHEVDLTADEGEDLRITLLRYLNVGMKRFPLYEYTGPVTTVVVGLVDGSVHRIAFDPQAGPYGVSFDDRSVGGTAGPAVHRLLDRLRR